MSKPRRCDRGRPPVPREILDRALDIVRAGGTIADAAEACACVSTNVSAWRKMYPWFAPALDQAKAEGAEKRTAGRARRAVLSRVRRGENVKDAAAAEGYTVPAVQGWRHRDPKFAADLDAAKAAGQAVRRARHDRAKAAVLTWIGKGKSANEACRLAGVTSATVSKWRSDDPGFDAEHARLVGPTRRPRGWVKFRRMLPLIRAGATVWNAARVVGLGPWPVYVWWEKQPAMWAEIVAAYEASGRTPPQRRVKSADERKAA